MDAEYIITVSASIAVKYSKVEANREGKYEIAKGTFKEIIKPFDVIKSLEELFKCSFCYF